MGIKNTIIITSCFLFIISNIFGLAPKNQTNDLTPQIIIKTSKKIKKYIPLPANGDRFEEMDIEYEEMIASFRNAVLKKLSLFPKHQYQLMESIMMVIEGHLLRNSIDAIYKAIDDGIIEADKGKISIEIEIKDEGILEVKLIDNGTGIPYELLQKWQKQKFESTKEETDRQRSFMGGYGQGMEEFLWPNIEKYQSKFGRNIRLEMFEHLDYEIKIKSKQKYQEGYQIFFPTPKTRSTISTKIEKASNLIQGTEITLRFNINDEFKSWNQKDGERVFNTLLEIYNIKRAA